MMQAPRLCNRGTPTTAKNRRGGSSPHFSILLGDMVSRARGKGAGSVSRDTAKDQTACKRKLNKATPQAKYLQMAAHHRCVLLGD